MIIIIFIEIKLQNSTKQQFKSFSDVYALLNNKSVNKTKVEEISHFWSDVNHKTSVETRTFQRPWLNMNTFVEKKKPINSPIKYWEKNLHDGSRAKKNQSSYVDIKLNSTANPIKHVTHQTMLSNFNHLWFIRL